MKKNIYLVFSLVLLIGCSTKKQLSNNTNHPVLTEQNTTTTVNLNTGIVLLPGLWEHLNFEKTSGQQYLKNTEGVIIAVAKNPKKTYPFYLKKQSGYETIQAYTNWEIEFQKENKRETKILKEEPKMEFQIWKFKDEKNIDNVFLYGNVEENILNLLVYTNSWTEDKKIEFLKTTLNRNKK